MATNHDNTSASFEASIAAMTSERLTAKQVEIKRQRKKETAAIHAAYEAAIQGPLSVKLAKQKVIEQEFTDATKEPLRVKMVAQARVDAQASEKLAIIEQLLKTANERETQELKREAGEYKKQVKEIDALIQLAQSISKPPSSSSELVSPNKSKKRPSSASSPTSAAAAKKPKQSATEEQRVADRVEKLELLARIINDKDTLSESKLDVLDLLRARESDTKQMTTPRQSIFHALESKELDIVVSIAKACVTNKLVMKRILKHLRIRKMPLEDRNRLAASCARAIAQAAGNDQANAQTGEVEEMLAEFCKEA